MFEFYIFLAAQPDQESWRKFREKAPVSEILWPNGKWLLPEWSWWCNYIR
jgi:hypothetical protein